MAIRKMLWMYLNTAACLLLFTACSTKLLETDPELVTDTGDVHITCNANEGDKGLLDYAGAVYVHVGLITSKSQHKDDWRYVKFNWGSRQTEAQATPSGTNQWTYHIKNIRKFFGVANDEQITRLAVLFRSGGCMDAYCKVLRNIDGSNLYIPINDKTVMLKK